MDGVQLLRLGKRLTDLAREVTTSSGESSLSPAEVAILEQVLHRPGSSVSDLASATGFAQSHVSTSVARLRSAGLLVAGDDPDDARITRLRLSARARRGIVRRAQTPADDVLRGAVGSAGEARRVVALLDELADLLLRPTG